MYFENRSLHKYPRVARGPDGAGVKSMIVILCYVQDVKAVRRMGRSLSDHHVVLCNVRLEGVWIRRR